MPKSSKRSKRQMKVIYKVIYPNRKIYVGSDLTDDICYVGSPNAEIIARDFTRKQRQDFTIRRKLLWESATASNSVVRQKEMEYIRSLRSNDPAIGYNRRPKFRGKK
jgi:putative N-acetylmannosamine-6-phosphate epimerase